MIYQQKIILKATCEYHVVGREHWLLILVLSIFARDSKNCFCLQHMHAGKKFNKETNAYLQNLLMNVEVSTIVALKFHFSQE